MIMKTTRKILAFIIAAAMLCSVMLLSSCEKDQDEESTEEPIVLTPKEKFLKTADTAEEYFQGLGNALGIELLNLQTSEDKMLSETYDFELEKLSMSGVPYIEQPISFSAGINSDVKNNMRQLLYKFSIGDETVPAEFLLSPDAYYINVDKVTDKTIKIPLENDRTEENTVTEYNNFKVKANEYWDFFVDNLDDELFTEQTGTVTVDGVEIENAETITLKATDKQLGEAVKAVLNKAKVDIQLTNLFMTMGFVNRENEDLLTQFKKAIDEMIESLDEKIEETSDDDYFVITVINEEEVLRSFNLTEFEDGEELDSLSFTTALKDGTYNIKGSLIYKEEKVVDLTYEQTANDKGSADGELEIEVNPPDIDVKKEGSADGPTSIISESGNFKIKVKFNGSKQDNKTTLDSKIEFSTEVDGMTVSIPLDLNITYEKVSDTEMQFSADISLSIMGTEAEFSLSGGQNLIDYEAIEVPSDKDVKVEDKDFDIQKLITGIITEYPVIAQFFSNFAPPAVDETDAAGRVFYTENTESIIYLYDDGTGIFTTDFTEEKHEDGKYSAKLFDGTVLKGTYSENEDGILLDGKEGYVLADDAGSDNIINENAGVLIILIDEGKGHLQTSFSYTVEGDTLKIKLATGGERDIKFVHNGDYYTINGLDYKWEYIAEQEPIY